MLCSPLKMAWTVVGKSFTLHNSVEHQSSAWFGQGFQAAVVTRREQVGLNQIRQTLGRKAAHHLLGLKRFEIAVVHLHVDVPTLR